MPAPFVSKPGQGQRMQLPAGQIAFIRVHGRDTGEAYSLLETRSPVGKGPGLHLHEREDESFYVLEGEYAFTLGDDTIEAKAGTLVFAPRGIPHGYIATGDRCRHLTIVTPPGFERFYEDSSEAAIAGQTAVAAVAERYGVTLLDARQPEDTT